MRGRRRNAIPAPALPHLRWRWRIRPGASLPGKRSRIISPKPDLVREKRHSPPCNFGVCSAVNTNFLPNLLTFGMKSAENRPRKASPFPLRPRRIPPVSRHCGKLPKILTFHRKESSGTSCEQPADSARPGCKLPKKLTSRPRKCLFRPISGFGSRKTSPSTRIFSRFFSPHVFQPLDLAEKWRESPLPNPLTVAFPVTSEPSPAVRDLRGHGLPYCLTLAGKSRIPPFLNPLTSSPAVAHRRSRSPPPICPAGAHPGSRKASPDRPEVPAR
jgi:hypothetical protein